MVRFIVQLCKVLKSRLESDEVENKRENAIELRELTLIIKPFCLSHCLLPLDIRRRGSSEPDQGQVSKSQGDLGVVPPHQRPRRHTVRKDMLQSETSRYRDMSPLLPLRDVTGCLWVEIGKEA